MTGTIWRRLAWSPEAAEHLKEEINPDDDLIRAEVESGAAILWHVVNHCHLITRMDTYEDGTRELVLVAIRGENIAPVMEQIKQAAKIAGIPSIRFHSSRKGAERFAKQWGFVPVETVYRFDNEQEK